MPKPNINNHGPKNYVSWMELSVTILKQTATTLLYCNPINISIVYCTVTHSTNYANVST